jgi:predicted transporter
MTPLIVFILCAVTSLACCVLLLRGYRNSGVRLLLWSGWCFGAFTLNNVLLIIDLRVLPAVDLSTLRTATALAGLCFLLYGLVWEDTRFDTRER